MTSSLRWGGGVIEGFYGRPWSRAERRQLFDWMATHGLTSYFHAPKDDPHHRVIWREPLPADAAAALAELISECRTRGIALVFALHPGLDIRYGSAADLGLLTARFEQVVAMGGRDFAVLFDDIPGVLTPEDAAVFGSLAEAQASVANQLQAWLAERLPEGRLLLCPTAYCTRMANAHLGGEGYLAELGRQLDPGVDVLWTGPEIISREISCEHLESIGRLLRRPPVIWDNLFADDYDGDRFFVGPYAGRPPEIASLVRGLLLNPNNELPLNFVACHTLGQFLANTASAEPATWQPRVAYQAALNDWLPSFALLSDTASVTLEDLQLLADCFYLPHEHGDLAVALLAGAARLLATQPREWRGEDRTVLDRLVSLEQLTSRLADLRDRPLFHAISRRLWALREELSLLRQRLANLDRTANGEPCLPDDDHLPGTFRGGLVAELRRLLPFPQASSGFTAASRGKHRLPLLRQARPDDLAACYRVCLETGDHGADGTPFYTDDPDALGRVFVGPYLAFEPGLSFVLEDSEGVCGYVLATADSKAFFQRYDTEWRPVLTAAFPEPTGDSTSWTRAEQMHREYHHPDYHCPEPADIYPAHAHIDLLPRVQGLGFGPPMMRHIVTQLRQRGVPGVHLGVSGRNERALGFYARLGFEELGRTGSPGDHVIYLGLRLAQDTEGNA
jgi:protein O-GlcNAcase/histone acetyltransferase